MKISTESAALAAVGVAGALFALSCSATDPAEIPVRNPQKTTGARIPDGGTSVVGVGGDGGGANLATGIFATAPPYVSQTGPNTVHAKHATSTLGKDNPAGANCLTCHTAGGAAAVRIWTAAGTVYTNKQGTVPAGAGIEVRAQLPTGAGISVYTDAAGNFVFDSADAGVAAFPDGTKVAVRSAAGVQSMVTPLSAALSGGACNDTANGCHGAPNLKISSTLL